MRTTTDLADLLHTIESVRSEMHPELDPSFLETIVKIEETHLDDDDAAVRAIESALRSLMEREGIN